jgi:hypothetical protein
VHILLQIRTLSLSASCDRVSAMLAIAVLLLVTPTARADKSTIWSADDITISVNATNSTITGQSSCDVETGNSTQCRGAITGNITTQVCSPCIGPTFLAGTVQNPVRYLITAVKLMVSVHDAIAGTYSVRFNAAYDSQSNTWNNENGPLPGCNTELGGDGLFQCISFAGAFQPDRVPDNAIPQPLSITMTVDYNNSLTMSINGFDFTPGYIAIVPNVFVGLVNNAVQIQVDSDTSAITYDGGAPPFSGRCILGALLPRPTKRPQEWCGNN